MSLKDLNLKLKYDSDEDNILKEFYIPALSESTEYYRLSGFFSSSSLAVAAEGMENFIKNDGKMELVTSVVFSEEDRDRIREAEEDPLKIIEENFIKDLDDISEEFKDNIGALGWMIAHGNLKIKVAYSKDYTTLFHPKVGILRDNEGNTLSFSGSDNETKNGWINNIEEFKVFGDWKEGFDEVVQSDIDSFDKYWYDYANKVKVMNVSKAIEDDIIKFAPDDPEKIVIHNLSENKHKSSKNNKGKKLRQYQREAFDSWFENDCRGIFELATGTGKTFTALKCLEKLYKEENIICVVACPLMYLVEQWAKEIQSFDTFKDDVYRFYGGNSSWKSDFNEFVLDLKLGVKTKGVIVTTHHSFSKDSFIKNILKCGKNNKLCLIADEMHHLSSKDFSKGLTDVDYDYRLGLSATPSIYMNEEATYFLDNYFGGIVSSFTIQDALSTINPETNEFYLTPYNYYPIKVELTSKEMDEYQKLTNKIINALKFTKKGEENPSLTGLFNKRRHIINNATEKDIKLRKILHQYDKLDHLIVFTTYDQKSRALKILGEENVTPRHEFTSNVSTKEIKEIGMSEREFLIDKFDKGEWKALVAIKCLDEGVDVPSADKVIIMSSGTNPREYVQRRGRVLRRFEGKKVATIFDMIVLPEYDGLDSTKNIIENETLRLYDFIESAKNKKDCYDLLEKWGI